MTIISQEADKINNMSVNRLSHRFSRLYKKKHNDSSNLNSIKDSIEKNIYITTRETKDNLDETEYFLKNMNNIASGMSSLLQTIYGNDKLKENPRIKKKDTSNSGFSIGQAITSALAISAVLVPIISEKFKNADNMIKNVKAPEKEKPVVENGKQSQSEDMFNLTSSDKLAIRKLQEKTGSQSDVLDKIVRGTTNGAIPSLASLIFGYYNFKNSGIYKLFKENIQSYSDEIVAVFDKIIKNLFTWFKDNIITPMNEGIETNYNNLKNSAIEKLNKLFGFESSNTAVISKQPVSAAGITLVSSMKSLVLTFFGKGDNNSTSDDIKDPVSIRNQEKKRRFNLFELKKDFAQMDNSDITGADFNFTGDVDIDGSIVNNGYVNKQAIYKAFIQAGFGGGQAAALTAEVGRENDYSANVLFGNHRDPARGSNIGFISWQGSRKRELIKRLKNAGVLKNTSPVLMDQTYASLLVMANYVMYEMKTTHSKQRKTQAFLANRNITFEQAAPLLGGNDSYIAWARQQTTIRKADGSRKAFNWKAQEAKAAKYHKQLAKELGGKGDEGETVESSKIRHEATFKEHANSVSDISHEINTRIMKNKIRSSFLDNKTETIPMIKNINKVSNKILSTPIQKIGKKVGTIDTITNSSSNDNYQKNKKSFFELLLEKDLTGNMSN